MRLVDGLSRLDRFEACTASDLDGLRRDVAAIYLKLDSQRSSTQPETVSAKNVGTCAASATLHTIEPSKTPYGNDECPQSISKKAETLAAEENVADSAAGTVVSMVSKSMTAVAETETAAATSAVPVELSSTPQAFSAACLSVPASPCQESRHCRRPSTLSPLADSVSSVGVLYSTESEPQQGIELRRLGESSQNRCGGCLGVPPAMTDSLPTEEPYLRNQGGHFHCDAMASSTDNSCAAMELESHAATGASGFTSCSCFEKKCFAAENLVEEVQRGDLLRNLPISSRQATATVFRCLLPSKVGAAACPAAASSMDWSVRSSAAVAKATEMSKS